MGHYSDIYDDEMNEKRESVRASRKTKSDKINALLRVDSEDKIDIVLRCLLEKMTDEQLDSLCEEYLDRYI